MPVNRLHLGRYLELVETDGWEYVSRCNNSGVVVIVAITPNDELLLVEQYRPPLGTRVLELPAGLSGDHVGTEDEPLVAAAKRELLEETGYEADTWRELGEYPVSAGLTNETVRLFFATGLQKITAGGGDASEDIEVLKVPLEELRDLLAVKRQTGVHIDAKIGAGLWMTEPWRA